MFDSSLQPIRIRVANTFSAQAIQSIDQSLFQHITSGSLRKKGSLQKCKKAHNFYMGFLAVHIDNIEDFSNNNIVTKHSLFERTQLFKSHETTQPIMISFFFSFLNSFRKRQVVITTIQMNVIFFFKEF